MADYSLVSDLSGQFPWVLPPDFTSAAEQRRVEGMDTQFGLNETDPVASTPTPAPPQPPTPQKPQPPDPPPPPVEPGPFPDPPEPQPEPLPSGGVE